MKKTKKILFFIVEGPSEKTALGTILSNLFNADDVVVEITFGDVTTKTGNNNGNIVAELGDIINKWQKRNPYLRFSDLAEIIHLIDTDGLYIPEIKIIEAPSEHKAVYKDSVIEIDSPKKIVDRNEQKQKIVDRLITLPLLKTCKYSMYYFSCNLDHVLHNDANLSDNKKVPMAVGFANKYNEDPERFVEFISDDTIAVKKSYEDSWAYLKKDCNSLKRGTNFNLFFDDGMAKNAK
jgi:hypothetical protein